MSSEQSVDQSPFEMLRIIIGLERTPADLQEALEAANYNLALAIASLTSQPVPTLTPNKPKGGQVCRFFLQGDCRRADCWFSHDREQAICRFWLQGGCLAGDACGFNHDPTKLVTNVVTSIAQHTHVKKTEAPKVDDEEMFPGLGGGAQKPTTPAKPKASTTPRKQQTPKVAPVLASEDDFPALGGIPKPKPKPEAPQEPLSMAQLVASLPETRPLTSKSIAGRNSSAHPRSSLTPAPPDALPWLETGPALAALYTKYRAPAIQHAVTRNKLLQQASDAWRRNDPARAGDLSAQGQAENENMRLAHERAAEAIFTERNTGLPKGYTDLHGLHPAEAVMYLEKFLLKSEMNGERAVYVVIGSGSHVSVPGKEKVREAVLEYLAGWGYACREFVVKGGFGGVVWVDSWSHY